MKQTDKPELKQKLSHTLAGLTDNYPDFDTCTWGAAKSEEEVFAIIGLIEEHPDITTSDIIDFQEWFQDQREDGNL